VASSPERIWRSGHEQCRSVIPSSSFTSSSALPCTSSAAAEEPFFRNTQQSTHPSAGRAGSSGAAAPHGARPAPVRRYSCTQSCLAPTGWLPVAEHQLALQAHQHRLAAGECHRHWLLAHCLPIPGARGTVCAPALHSPGYQPQNSSKIPTAIQNLT
jgi:hypothetical protein